MSKRTMCVMWLKSGLRATVGLKEQERWSCLVADPHWCMGSLTVWAHHSYLFTHQTPHATLIHALLWWVSVGKHLFSRHALLHLRVVTASACKQGDANCLSPSFYGTQGEQTNKSGNFTQQPVKHSHSAHGGKCNQVPSAVIQPRTHRNMPTWKQMSTISHTHTIAWVLCSTCDMSTKSLVVYHIIFVVLSKWPRHPLVWFLKIVWNSKYLKLQDDQNRNN